MFHNNNPFYQPTRYGAMQSPLPVGVPEWTAQFPVYGPTHLALGKGLTMTLAIPDIEKDDISVLDCLSSTATWENGFVHTLRICLTDQAAAKLTKMFEAQSELASVAVDLTATATFLAKKEEMITQKYKGQLEIVSHHLREEFTQDNKKFSLVYIVKVHHFAMKLASSYGAKKFSSKTDLMTALKAVLESHLSVSKKEFAINTLPAELPKITPSLIIKPDNMNDLDFVRLLANSLGLTVLFYPDKVLLTNSVQSLEENKNQNLQALRFADYNYFAGQFIYPVSYVPPVGLTGLWGLVSFQSKKPQKVQVTGFDSVNYKLVSSPEKNTPDMKVYERYDLSTSDAVKATQATYEKIWAAANQQRLQVRASFAAQHFHYVGEKLDFKEFKNDYLKKYSSERLKLANLADAYFIEKIEVQEGYDYTLLTLMPAVNGSPLPLKFPEEFNHLLSGSPISFRATISDAQGKVAPGEKSRRVRADNSGRVYIVPEEIAAAPDTETPIVVVANLPEGTISAGMHVGTKVMAVAESVFGPVRVSQENFNYNNFAKAALNDKTTVFASKPVDGKALGAEVNSLSFMDDPDNKKLSKAILKTTSNLALEAPDFQLDVAQDEKNDKASTATYRHGKFVIKSTIGSDGKQVVTLGLETGKSRIVFSDKGIEVVTGETLALQADKEATVRSDTMKLDAKGISAKTDGNLALYGTNVNINAKANVKVAGSASVGLIAPPTAVKTNSGAAEAAPASVSVPKIK